MEKLSKAGTNPQAFAVLGSNEYSKKFSITKTGSLAVYVLGTFSSQTVTMEVSPNGTDWQTFAIDLNGSGTPVNQTWIGSGDINPRPFKLVTGMWFRFHVSSGGSPAITIWLGGDHFHIKQDS